MPSTSAAQHRAMEAAAHGKSNLGIPRRVGQEFSRADRGRSFDAAEEAPASAAGTIFVAPDGAVLLLLRSPAEANYAGHWGLPGGGGEPGETPAETAAREADEELGSATRHAWMGEPTLVQETETPTGLTFSTFVQPVRYRFVPELTGEHSGYAWVSPEALPTPMHPAVLATLRAMYATEAATAAQDDADGEKVTKASVNYSPGKGDHRCERCEHWEQGRCALVAGVIDPDYWCEKFEFNVASDSVAMDEFAAEGSVRTKDADGHLHVARTPLSKATVNEYYGREVSHWRDLRLDPDRRYRLLRDPVELAKGAETFNGLPLLRRHVRTSAEDYQQDEVVGATGTEAAFEAPYLTNALVVWSQEDIDSIESGEKRELSASYGYRADMTPGTYEGMPYDGVMRDIVGNHVALVIQGRAGPDVVVGDEMPPGLAATTPSSGVPAMAGRTSAEDDARGKYSERDREAASSHVQHRRDMPESAFLQPAERKYPVKEKKDGQWVYDRDLLLGAAREARMHGHDDIAKRADTIREREFKDKSGKDGDNMTEAKDGKDLPVPGGGRGKGPAGDRARDEEDRKERREARDRRARDAEPDKSEELKERLKDKMSAEDWKAACDSIDDLVKAREEKASNAEEEDDDEEEAEDRRRARDSEEDDHKERREDDDPDPEGTNRGDSEDEPRVSKKAMDAAISSAVAAERRRVHAVDAARAAVRPHVGEVHLAFDSADDVYAHALKTLGVETRGVHPSAFPALLRLVPKPSAGRTARREAELAMDGARGTSFLERFPEVAKVRTGPAH